MTTTSETTVSLADQLAAAEQAQADARARVSGLEAAMTRAASIGEFTAAMHRKAELAEARRALVTADAVAAAFRAGAAEAQRAAAAEDQFLAEARHRAEAERALEVARADEVRRREQVAAAIEELWAAVDLAQQQLRSALACEMGVSEAQIRQIQARARLGEFGTDNPGPKPAGSNQVSALVESDALLSKLAAWSR